MSIHMSKKQKVIHLTKTVYPYIQLPDCSCRTLKKHINSIYVGTILRVYDPQYGEEGQLVTVHWVTDEGLFCTLHNKEKCSFIKLKYKTWVVDHRHVRPGAFRLYE